MRKVFAPLPGFRSWLKFFAVNALNTSTLKSNVTRLRDG